MGIKAIKLRLKLLRLKMEKMTTKESMTDEAKHLALEVRRLEKICAQIECYQQ